CPSSCPRPPHLPLPHTPSLHDALPIFRIEALVDKPIVADPRLRDDLARRCLVVRADDEHRLRTQELRHRTLRNADRIRALACGRSEEHTSELQSPDPLVCRLLRE